MNKQKAFSLALHKVIQQGCKSTDKGTSVLQKSSKVKCAIGWLLQSYEPRLESLGAVIGNGHPVILARLPKRLKRFPKFLTDIQNAHDLCIYDTGPNFIKEFKRNMTHVAKKHTLEMK